MSPENAFIWISKGQRSRSQDKKIAGVDYDDVVGAGFF